MTRRRVVVTGMGTVNPLGNDIESTWASVVNGRSGIATITAFDTEGYKTTIGGEVKEFDAIAIFGRREARRMDRAQHLAMAAADQAIKSSGLTINDENKDRIGCVLGSGIGGIIAVTEGMRTLIEKGPARVSPFVVPMMLPDSAPGLISIHYGIRGPNLSIATACASSNNALGEAAEIIRRGDADVMVSGGAEAGMVPLCVAGFNAMGALSTRNDSPETASRPFDATRDGFVPAEGSAILILEALAHAEARGATILGEFMGYGTSADAYHISAPHENGEGAIRAMNMALADAGLEPAGIDYINAHGTSTSLNDKSETAALKKVFGESVYDTPVSSTKSLHGHLLGSTSAVEAIISLKAMAEDTIPATFNYETPDPECDLDYVPNSPRKQPFDTFMSNGFGFGGHNAVVVMGKFKG